MSRSSTLDSPYTTLASQIQGTSPPPHPHTTSTLTSSRCSLTKALSSLAIALGPIAFSRRRALPSMCARQVLQRARALGP
eukprot:CAMPEP_0183363476 /NCGR_PEP_ID=MMETSP0164_2-20130417/75332_1 /TAXON_ID=221442 /ORGANISM="Coccolithus pelagicus ssp braarudi, Strain PLY182g" /LENGTH=79 /DNA_ID=CAMNT_0025538581 /DNA_START=75 /DNA_END=310 /DNA_ORIENTATION=+